MINSPEIPLSFSASRRSLLRALGAGVTGLGLAACGKLADDGAQATGSTLKIGFVSPRTGPAASFGEPDGYVLSLARKAFAGGLTIGGTRYDLQIIDRDGQSNPQRGAQVANDLINSDGVDLMLATSTPETVNPVSDACEAAGVPCISTVVPWEAWYFGRGAKPEDKQAFKYTYHFCFGVEQFHQAYTHLWPQVPTNKKVGVMWPNDSDGNAIRAALGPLLAKDGYTIVDPGAYTDGTNDFSAQIAKFKAEGVEIFNTFPIPPDFATFWRQAAQQGFRPRIAQIAKTGLFPSQVEALGDIGAGLASAAYWTPTYPYTSALTKVSSKELADGYQNEAGKQWSQQLGPSLALFDVAAAALRAVANPKDRAAVAKAIGTLDVQTPVGRLRWGKGPNGNVVATPILGGQWVRTTGGKYPLDFVLCENSSDPNVPVAAQLKAYGA
ncbi:ABC transporter substrate-binding protein [Actinoplanes regularis]|uniref:Amino acid/amide ABC transporter substrate-binding protein, HAAT family n=1 Tax=Actinoplanes regularis TaxID=52697 RepID=A0A238VZV2_9ACTN|nr:ABC transporter substrate-binding protein [Actinoplanes regularis]GIE91955.1 ABC transporter substrate-binding protein [Actinoplanes regularis]SNR39697.1 amino acid/amide ABC transporter substrate-binding protein, HAAT family [Actinoplanes regularis]